MTDPPVFFRELQAGMGSPTWRALGEEDPEMGLHLLSAIHAQEDAALRRQIGAQLGRQFRARLLTLRPDRAEDIDDLVEAYLSYRSLQRLTRALTFLYGHKSPPFLSTQGLDALLDHGRHGDPVVLVPFHIGHHSALLGALVGLGLPLTTIAAPETAQVAAHQVFPARLADGDLRVLSAASPAILYQCRRALREGRTVLWYPDLYTGRGRPDVDVTFLDVTFLMSSALPIFCRREGAISVPCLLRASRDASSGEPALELLFGPSIQPPHDRGDVGYLQSLCDHYSELLDADGASIEWKGWEDGEHVQQDTRAKADRRDDPP